MDVKKLMLLLGALVMAGVSAFMAKSLFGGAAPEAAASAPQVPVGPEIMVATRTLPVGTIIEPEMVRYTPWPADLVEKAYFIRSEGEPKDLIGTVVRYPITAGQPITQGALVKPGDRGFLAAALGPGMRAVTVSVSDQSSVAGFIFPGDRVDLMLTQAVSGGGDGEPLKATETFIRNMRVLATDQRTDNVPNEEGKPVVTRYSTVTLEATPKLAEKIAVAQTIGSLSLSLRSIADNNAELDRAIASGEVKVPEGKDPKADKVMMLQIASRPIDIDTTYTTGADVSRFQRSSVPARTDKGNPNATGTQVSSLAAPRMDGPTVRIARGNVVTEVPVGGK